MLKTYLKSVSIIALLAAPGAALAQEDETAAPDIGADEIIVTASPIERTVEETIIGTSIVDDEELQRRLENSIGETLRREPGVTSTYFGPGASRPIIRGLGGDRIRVLDAGIGSIDASASSPDHAVAVEPATAERIEIVRGPATLLYGSSAAGGVVNVFNGRIPSAVPEDGVDGALRIGKSTVDGGTEAAGGFDLNLGQFGDGAIVFHGDGFYRKGDDYDIPGFAESAAFRAVEEAEEEEHEDEDEEHGHEEEEEAFGLLENSFFETKGGSAGLSYVFSNGFFGVSGTAIDTNYGVPGGHGHEEEEEHHDEDEDEDHEDEDHEDEEHGHEEEEEGGVTINLKQRRLDLQGEIEADFLIFQKAKIRLGYADYEHSEIEPSGEVGTLFTNEGWEGRIELVDQAYALGGGELNGAVGFQFRSRDFSAIGEEAFVPPTETTQFGFFGLKEYEVGALRFELGGRYESTNHEVQETGFDRDFDAFSVSGGVGVKPMEHVFFGVTGFRTERAPSTEELFSNGPHLATEAFEVGDPTLDEEVARGVEATARFHNDRFFFGVNGFYTSYKDFIYEAETGEEEDGLPVFEFQAVDATFRGFEAEAEAEIFRTGAFDIHLDAAVDYVRATIDTAGNENLPRIPPMRFLSGIEAQSKHVDLRFEVEHTSDQDDTADFELPTEGYTSLNTFVTLRPVPDAANLSVRLSATNLTNEDIRYHTSFLKDVAPLPGRNFRVSVTGAF